MLGHRLTRDHVVWAYRLLLDREPESEAVIGPKLAGSETTAELRRHLMTSAEFQQKNPDFAHTNDRTIVIKEIAPAVRLFIDLADHVIGLNILRGRYEEDASLFMKRLLEPGDTAIDAGAHIGFFTMQMAAAVGPLGKIYAFEPLDANAELLERSIAENRFADRIVFRRAAVGASAGTATLTFAAESLNSGGAYLLQEGALPLAGNETREVPLVALDDLLGQNNALGAPIRRPFRLIKMDVEGAEPQVVRGAARLLSEDRPIVLSEIHPTQLERASGADAPGFLNQMRELGYRAHRLVNPSDAARYKEMIGPALERAPEALASIVFLPAG